MTAAAGSYAGLDRFEARKQVVADLEGARAAGEDRAVQAERRQVPSLQDGGRAAGFEAVVDEDEAAGRAGHRAPWKTGASRSFPRTGRRPISSGCTTSATGASRGSCGGAIAFRRGIAAIAGEITVAREDADDVFEVRLGEAARRNRTCSTPGSAPGCGRSRRSAGRTRRRI